MNRFELAAIRTWLAGVVRGLRADPAGVPALARSCAGGSPKHRTVVGWAVVTAGSIAGLLSTGLGAVRPWRGKPPFRCQSKASCRIDCPPTRILLLAAVLLGVVAPRFAHGAEGEGPAKEHVESVSLPIDRESGAMHEGAPSPPSDARPRGLGDALYMHVGIDLPALDAATIRTMRLQHGPDWLGPHRTLPESAAAELPGTWGLTSAGEPIWRVTIRSPQAAAVAIRFETFDVDGEVWVYTHDGEAFAGPYSGRGPRGNSAFWSDPLPADTVTVEYFPRRRGIGETMPPFRIPEISHHARLEPRKSVASPLVPRRSETPGDSERSSLSPYKDATCSAEFLRRGGHDQERLVDAVAMMLSRRETGSYQCTAFVLRNLREGDGTTLPSYYDAVFTSGNCIRNQREAVDATFYWKYRTSTCDGPPPSLGSLEVTRGARLWDRKWTESAFGTVEDYALLLVPRDELPSDVYRAGWTTADVVRGEDVYTLGHPWGEPLRLAVGDVDDPDEGSWLFYSPSFGVGADYGRSGPGTSGSPVFGRLAEDGRLLGILRGTSESLFQSREWVVHKFGSVRGDFRHLRHVGPSTQRVSYRMGSDTHWFTFYESNFLQGWVLNNKRVVESGDTFAQGGASFVVERQDGRWNVRLVDVHGNTRKGATGISVGSAAQGSIDTPRDVDWFRFEATEPTTVEVYTTGAADTVGAVHGGTEREDDNSGEGTNFWMQVSVPAGVHYVMVSGSDPEGLAQGEYTLHVRYADVHGNSRSAATAVALGSSTGGLIGTAGDVDWFRFETTGPRTVEVYTTGGMDTVGAVNGAEDDNGGESSNFSIRTTVSGGTHYVRVAGAGSATGSYSLHVRSLFSENALGMEFACVGAGDFVMGSPEGEAGRWIGEVQRAVRISQAFWMGKHEVTQGQWEAVMGSNPSYFKGCGARCPVESVSWEDAEEFIRRLNERETGTGNRYRLPTEAEWEYAARAGTTAATPEGDLRILGKLNAPVLDGQAWYGGNSGVSYPGAWGCSQWEERQYEAERCGTHPVGMKRANGWGLHDMLGNVSEWTADWYGWYPTDSETDPQGPGTGSKRVYRGGDFNSYASYVRVATRGVETPDARHSYRGFRVVRSDALECAQPYPLTLGGGRWTDDHADTQGFATAVRFGSSTSGTIYPGDEDWFRVETGSSAPAAVEVYTTGETDTIGWLYANGTHAIGDVAEDDNGGDGRNFLIRAEVSPDTPNINVRVRGSAPNADGRYRLHVRPAAGSAISGPLGMEFAWVPPGRFVMGSPEGEAGRHARERQHEVRISRGYWMGRYEVTRGQWEAVMGAHPREGTECGPDCPANSVSWEEVQEFIGRLNEREAGSGYWYRLPTEAEWEYAARAGTAGARYGPLGEIAWYDANSQEKLHRVGLKRANAWGLHDMLGNVMEWVGDWYGEYASGAAADPQGPRTGSSRVIRGGSWAFPAEGARSAFRASWRPDDTLFLFGFRLVRTE